MIDETLSHAAPGARRILGGGGGELPGLRRSRSLPLLAAVLIGLAALLSHSSQPAQAQSAVWDTELTVRQLDGGQDHDNDPTTPRTLPTKFGCDNGNTSEFPELGKCSTGSLTDDEFNFGGTFYTVTSIELQPDESGGRLTIRFNKGASAALKRAALRVGSLTLKMSEASYSGSNTRALWDNTGLDWDLAEHVRFTLTPGAAPPPDAVVPSTVTVNVLDATLNVKTLGGLFGCAGSGTNPCSDTAVLTARQFTHDGQSNTITQVDYYTQSGGILIVYFAKGLHPDHVQDLSLATEDAQGRTVVLPLSSATVETFVETNDVARWNNLTSIPQGTQSNPNNQNPSIRHADLQWSGGESVPFKLTRQAPPPPDDWQSWSPTLTVQRVANNFGCNNIWADAAKRCSAVLADDDFVFEGKTYTVSIIARNNVGVVTFSTKTNMLPESLKNYTLRLGDGYLPFGDAGIYTGTLAVFVNAGATWKEGDRIPVRLLQGGPPSAPFELKLEPGGSGRIAATWNAPLAGTYKAAVTGYEVAYRQLDIQGNVAGDWLTRKIGRSTGATISGLDGLYTYQVRVRALSASGPGPWNKPLYKDYEVGAPGATPLTGEAPSLRILSASRTTVREGDAAITITARLARNAEAERVIHISHGSNHGLDTAMVQKGLTLATVASACTPVSPDKDYTLSPASITIPAGQRTGTATLTVCDDITEDSGEYISLRPVLSTLQGGATIPEAFPTSGSGAYQVESLQITILNDETNEPEEGAQPDDGGGQPPPRDERQAAGAETLLERYDADDSGTIEKSEVIRAIDDYLFGTGDDAPTKADVIELINLYLFG